MSELFTLALAVYRAAQLLAVDDGPGACFKLLRCKLGCQAAWHGGVWREAALLINCPYCLGIWLAGLAWFVRRWAVGRLVLQVLAVAGLQTIMESWSGNGRYTSR